MVKAQFPEKLAFLFQPKRYKILYGGRGGAKSWGVARAALITSAERPLRWLCAREFQKSIADSVHQVLKDQIDNLGLGDFYKVTETSIVGINGSQFSFEGLRHNTGKIKSYEGVDRLWVEEAHSTSKASWELLIPTIRKDGSEIWATLNPEFEEDDSYQRFIVRPPEDAYVVELNYRDNPWFPPVLEKERLQLQKRDPDAYDHVWEGRCRKWLEGAIYAKELRKVFLEKRVTEVAFDRMFPVYTAWDLGHTDDTAIWWYQVVAGEVRVLEYYASNGGSLSEYATQILGVECQIDLIGNDVVCTMGLPVPGLEHRRLYQYGRHWLPHDARAKTLVAKGKSTIEQLSSALTLQKLGIVPDVGVEDGIQAVRSMFHRCWFDKDGTEEGVRMLRRYQRKLQEDGVSFSPHPKHDFTSHGADAFRMLAVAWQHEEKLEKKAVVIPFRASVEPVGDTLDAMWAASERYVERVARV